MSNDIIKIAHTQTMTHRNELHASDGMDRFFYLLASQRKLNPVKVPCGIAHKITIGLNAEQAQTLVEELQAFINSEKGGE
jgi:hypothetical protein